MKFPFFENDLLLIFICKLHWISASWEMVHPGCEAPQKDLITEGSKRTDEDKFGLKSKQCIRGVDESRCYGAEICDTDRNSCTCADWSPREQVRKITYDLHV